MHNLPLILAVLEDYCELQTSGEISGANRYSVSNVQEQISIMESGKLSGTILELQKLLEMPENTLAASLLKQRNQFKKLGEEIEQLKRVREGLEMQLEILKSNASSAYGDGYYDGYLQYADDCGDPDYKGDAMRRSEMAESKSVYGQENDAPRRLAVRDVNVTIKAVVDFCNTLSGYQDVYPVKDKMGIPTSLSHHREEYIGELKSQAGVN